MNTIGIMQGRLSPPSGGRIQSFPAHSWRDEFELARRAGLDCIEWIYEAETEEFNPLRTDQGLEEMHVHVRNTGTKIESICADYYMTRFLVDALGTLQPQNTKHLEWLIQRAALLPARYIILPFVDASSLRTSEAVESLMSFVLTLVPQLRASGVELHLETDLPPQSLARVLERIGETLVRANYDIGNSASLGHDPKEELTLLKEWLGSVHVKDRVRGGGTVPLGTGSADFQTCFQLIHAARFQGPFILQVAREQGLSELDLAIRNREFVEGYFAVRAA